MTERDTHGQVQALFAALRVLDRGGSSDDRAQAHVDVDRELVALVSGLLTDARRIADALDAIATEMTK